MAQPKKTDGELIRVTRSLAKANESRRQQQRQAELQARLQSENVFLKLPAEARNLIYLHFLSLSPRTKYLPCDDSPSPLASTCSQIRQEFLPLLRAYHTYYLEYDRS